jgi:hypothetical protein
MHLVHEKQLYKMYTTLSWNVTLCSLADLYSVLLCTLPTVTVQCVMVE